MTLVLGILAASLLGSIHCAGMCGPFVCLYAGGPGTGGAGARAHAAYNLGRLVSYAVLGAGAGALGARVDDLGRLAGIGRAAAILAGALMVVWALSQVAGSLGARVGRGTAPEWARRRLGAVLLAVRSQSPVVRAAATGLVTSLLPCGWLYTFVVAAGGTGSASLGAAVMLVFWVGTVPMLLAVGVGARRALGPIARRLPMVSAAAVLVLGLLAISGRVRAPALPHDMTHAMSHGGR